MAPKAQGGLKALKRLGAWRPPEKPARTIAWNGPGPWRMKLSKINALAHAKAEKAHF
jgi:hypothetical protein